MKSPLRFLVLLVSIFMIAQRSPAPIVEEGKPTPASEQTAKAKTKRVSKPKVAKAKSGVTSQKRTTSQATMPIQNRFDGTWMGTLHNLPFAGDVDFTLFVSGSGTSVIEKSVNFGTNTFQVNCDGNTMRWETGSSWTLTPNPDGQTASITCNNPGLFGLGAFNLSTIFRKSSVAQIAIPVASHTGDTLPVAKAVANKPGFVYNPFDPLATRLLDVRGKPSGSKVKDPVSGKIFIVP